MISPTQRKPYQTTHDSDAPQPSPIIHSQIDQKRKYEKLIAQAEQDWIRQKIIDSESVARRKMAPLLKALDLIK